MNAIKKTKRTGTRKAAVAVGVIERSEEQEKRWEEKKEVCRKNAVPREKKVSGIELKNSNHIAEYKDVVLWCCLHDTCYDSQCELGRGVYLYKAITLFEDKYFFEEAIIKKFGKDIWNPHLFGQLCEILYQFASNGSVTAREALYWKYDALFNSLTKNCLLLHIERILRIYASN